MIDRSKRAGEDRDVARAPSKSMTSDLVARLSPAGIVQIDGDGGIVDTNAQWHRLTGVAPGPELRARLRAAIHPEDRERVAVEWRDIVALRQAARFDCRVVHATGRASWLRIDVAPDRTPSGDLLGFVGVVIDIDDLKRAEAKAAASEERLLVALEAGGLGSFDWDLASNHVDVTDGYRRVWGLSPEEAVTVDTLAERMHPGDREMFRQGIRAGVRGETDRTESEFRVIDREGATRWLRNTARLYRDAEGKPVRRVGVVRDISERRARVEALAANEQRLGVAVAAANLGLWEWDVASGDGWWSDRAREIMGIAEDRLMTPEEHVTLIHPDDRAMTAAAGTALIREGRAFALQYRVLPPGGGERWVASRGAATRDANGRTVRATGTIADITEDRLAAERLRESEERLRLAQRAGQVGVFDWHVETDTSWWSPETFRIYGRDDPKPPTYAEWQRLNHPEDLPRMEAVIAKAVAGEQRYEIETRIVRANDGAVRRISIRAEILRDGDGKATRIVGGLTDVTERRENEGLLTDVLESTTDRVVIVDADWTYVYQNRRAEALIGNVIGRNLWEVFPILAGSATEVAFRHAMAARSPETVESFNETTRRWTRAHCIPTSDRLAMFFTDVTDMKLAQQALAESEERLRLAVDNAEVGFWDVDIVNDRLIWPARTKAMFGISPDVPVTMQDFYDGLHPEDRDATGAAYAAAADPALRAFYDVEYRTVGKEDGLVRWVAAKGRGVFAGDGPEAICLRVAGTAIDVTAAKRAEAVRAAQQAVLGVTAAGTPMRETLAAIVEAVEAHSTAGVLASILLADGDTLTLGAAPSLPAAYNAAIEGVAIGEGVGSCGTAAHRREAVFVSDIATDPLWVDFRALAGEHGLAACWSMPILSPDGALLGTFALYYGEPREADDADRELVAFVARSASLAIERGRAEAARDAATESLAKSEADFRALGENLPSLCWMASADGSIYWYNKRWYDYTGATPADMQGWGWQSVHDPEILPGVMEQWTDAIARGVEFEMTFPLRGADGQFRPFLTRIVPLRDDQGAIERWFGNNVDVSAQTALMEELRQVNASLAERVATAVAEREAAMAQLHEAQKLETLGQLTGGVAHDFNNLLTPIVGSLDLMKRRHGDDPRDLRLIEGGLAAAERATTLVQRLLAFGRRQLLQPRAVDVAALIAGMADLMRRTIGPQVEIATELPGDLPAARVDPNQLELALLNLAVNARDAMPGGGLVRIAAGAREVGIGDMPGLAPGRYIRIDVTDTGTGMDADTLRRAVEPFFTTKGVGKGTGLGLSMVHGLAAQLGGALTFDSAPGKGTRAGLWLPVAAEPAGAVERDAARPPAGNGAAATILLVDDEELVRARTADMLAELGYAVIEAESGEAALRVLDAAPKIDAMVTDFLMPEMTGGDLVAAVRERLPGLPVLVVTGYADPETLALGAPVLAKPFRHDALAERVAALIDPDNAAPRRDTSS